MGSGDDYKQWLRVWTAEIFRWNKNAVVLVSHRYSDYLRGEVERPRSVVLRNTKVLHVPDIDEQVLMYKKGLESTITFA